MVSETDVKRLAQRSFHAVDGDGLTELACGTYLLVAGALLPRPHVVAVVVLVPLLFLAALTKLRQRYTYPRVGYARPPAERPLVLLRGIGLYLLGCAALLLLGLLAAYKGALTAEIWKQWVPLWAGLCLTGGFISTATRRGTWLPLLYAAASVAAGVGASLAPASHYLERVHHLALVLGGVLVAGGLLTFLMFLHRHPVVEEGEDLDVP